MDEASAIQWLRRELTAKPRTAQELTPIFMKELQSWAKHEQTIELRDLLQGNFLEYDGIRPVPSQIHRYLSTNFKELRNLSKEDPHLVAKAKERWYVPDPSKALDLEKLREKSLLREFEDYKVPRTNKLKTFRTEAVRVGFKAAYDAKDYATIVSVAHKLPENVLQEDEKLLMYYDVASMRGGDSMRMLSAATGPSMPRARPLAESSTSRRCGARAAYRVWLPTQSTVLRARLAAPCNLWRAGQRDVVCNELSFVSAARAHRRCDGARRAGRAAQGTVIPLPHQFLALRRADVERPIRYLLADEVGLGKTIEAGLILRELKIRGLVRRVLVVAPAGLVLSGSENEDPLR